MTEEEAKTKWCPMSESKLVGDDDKCIASECMWWVEDEWIKTRIKGQEGHFTNEPAGHCGAAK